MQIVLFTLLAIGFCFLLGKIGEHQNVKSTGGVINQFNDIFNYIYKIPHTYVVSQSDYVVKLRTDTDTTILDWTLTYEMGKWCRIRCTVSYYDGTTSSGKPLDITGPGYHEYFIDRFLEEHHISRE